ncbi:uncharacterized protein BDZ99DRAFT_479614 [Mytilinidion resinicola]|uniref:Uncharacterized protein n=1 Tax=Mytilinidion resinicola TaxID=574789 RepID=A0A6A6YED1_9PEZI|nr:uncharacterized protein BDZ99DRAFT_479614 [Mytilinidion resinicola]KAF2806354.1 hypothetical protein BDZ99DRAFT_479614 [Mytilinidion resinicola]
MPKAARDRISVISQAPSPTAIADFVVDKANPISAAYSGAVRRRRQKIPKARVDLAASRELSELYWVISDMFPSKTSAKDVLEKSLQDTKSFQDLIDLLEQHSSKVVSSYDAIYPREPPHLTSLGHLDPTTIQPLQGAAFWEKLKRKLSSS